MEGTTVDVLGDAIKGYIVNVVREKDEEAVRIPPSISSNLKPHQVCSFSLLLLFLIFDRLVIWMCLGFFLCLEQEYLLGNCCIDEYMSSLFLPATDSLLTVV